MSRSSGCRTVASSMGRKMQSRLRMLACSTAIVVGLFGGTAVAQAQGTDAGAASPPPPAVKLQSPAGLKPIFDEALKLIQLAQASQERIDKTANDTSRLLREYQTVLREIESLKAYNAQQRRVIADQNKQISELQKSIDNVVKIRREITPLMLRMIDALADFVELDVPFLLDERRKRVQDLRDFMDDSDISPSEKFRLVLEAYQIESEYGRTIESYRGVANVDGNEREVDFLRIGRVLLAYQTLDREQQGFWNPRTKKWEALGGRYSGPIQAAIRFAKKQAAPNMYLLPVHGPTQAQE